MKRERERGDKERNPRKGRKKWLDQKNKYVGVTKYGPKSPSLEV